MHFNRPAKILVALFVIAMIAIGGYNFWQKTKNKKLEQEFIQQLNEAYRYKNGAEGKKIAVRVGGEHITLGELAVKKAEIKVLAKAIGTESSEKDFTKNALIQLINDALFYQYYRDQGIKVDDATVRETLVREIRAGIDSDDPALAAISQVKAGRMDEEVKFYRWYVVTREGRKKDLEEAGIEKTRALSKEDFKKLDKMMYAIIKEASSRYPVEIVESSLISFSSEIEKILKEPEKAMAQ